MAQNVQNALTNVNDIASEVNDLKSNNAKQSLSLKKDVEKHSKFDKRKPSKPTKMFKVAEEMVDEIIELENGMLAMTCVKEHKIRIFDYLSGKLKKELYAHNDFIMGMISVPQRNQLISYGCEKDIKIWSVNHNFMLIKQFYRVGMINKVIMMSPTLFMIEESQSGSLFKPKKITEIISTQSGSTCIKFGKDSGIGTCLGILPKSKTLMFTKNGESGVKFCKIWMRQIETINKYKPKYSVKKCYELDMTRVIAIFRDIGMFIVYDFTTSTEMYSLCPHSNDIIRLSVREYVSLKIPNNYIKRKLSNILDIDWEEKEYIPK